MKLEGIYSPEVVDYDAGSVTFKEVLPGHPLVKGFVTWRDTSMRLYDYPRTQKYRITIEEVEDAEEA